jgi:hypothetical protein
MAIHGARPITISPVRYSGSFGRKVIASKNIKKGPTIHVIKSEENKRRLLFKVAGTFAKSTLVSGGYIMRMSPIAKGILVVPMATFDNNPSTLGIIFPRSTPTPMAKKIHRVRKRSRNFNRILFISN